jgi:tRNA A-37 threonylcarbamoyl transferase component Bud32
MSDSIDSTKPNVCSVCGAVLSDAAGGLCPRCLLADAAQPTHVPGTAPGGEPPSQAEVTAAFPQFEIIQLIGVGGMGTVWRARQPKLGRHVALKLLPASLAERDPAFAERFEREGQLLARLHHPNIVAVHDSGRAGNFFYLVMEFVDGVNLRQAMRASRFTPTQALAIVPKICDALQYAHEEGVLHRDIKPENILLDVKGRVKLVDFGIAKLVAQPEAVPVGAVAPGVPLSSGGSLTLGDAALGTPNYMAPEQIEKPADVDHRADIYSLGVVFYELLTGELPQGEFAPPSEKSAADPRLDGIVRQALEKERARRQQSVGEMRTQVETIAGTPAGEAPEPAAALPARATSRPLSRHGWEVVIWGIVLAAACVDMGLHLTPVEYGWSIGGWGVLLFLISAPLAFLAGADVGKIKRASQIVLVDGIVVALAGIWCAWRTPMLPATWRAVIMLAILGGLAHCVRSLVKWARVETPAKACEAGEAMPAGSAPAWPWKKLLWPSFLVVAIVIALKAYVLSPYVAETDAVSPVEQRVREMTDQLAATPAFGPEIELLVKEAADLDTGKLDGPPESVTNKPNLTENILDAVAWMEREGMDVFADTPSHFFGVGMRAMAQDKSQWDQLTAPQVVALLDASITKVSTYVTLEPVDGSATFVIQTREGAEGCSRFSAQTRMA